MTEPKAMREIHEIREKIYEETRNMTPTEFNAFVRKNTDDLLKETGYKLVSIYGKPGHMRMARIETNP
jgi:hypothetical protein